MLIRSTYRSRAQLTHSWLGSTRRLQSQCLFTRVREGERDSDSISGFSGYAVDFRGAAHTEPSRAQRTRRARNWANSRAGHPDVTAPAALLSSPITLLMPVLSFACGAHAFVAYHTDWSIARLVRHWSLKRFLMPTPRTLGTSQWGSRHWAHIVIYSTALAPSNFSPYILIHCSEVH